MTGVEDSISAGAWCFRIQLPGWIALLVKQGFRMLVDWSGCQQLAIVRSSSARRSSFSAGGKSSAWIRSPIWTLTTITTSTPNIASNAKTAPELIRRMQKI
jgi:hypothetical protein